MDTAEFENKRWPTYQQGIEFRHRAALSLLPRGSVLDVGPGDGLFLSLVRDIRDDHIEGADISEESVRRCEQKGIKAKIIQTAERLPYPDEAFESVVLLDVLEHTYEPVPILKEALRVASHSVIVGVPNFSSLPARLQVLFGRVPENNYPQKGHIYWFNNTTLQYAVQSSGGCIAEKLMNVQRPFKPFATLLLALFPNLFALSFVIKIQK